MWLFKRKRVPGVIYKENGGVKSPQVTFETSVLRKNNITRLSIDERWTKLFVSIKMSMEIQQAETEMNELIKKEAVLKNEQENLEPKKRKCMNEIMNLTKEAFENENKEAREKLKDYKKEIEKINSRVNNVLEDIEKLDDELRTANLKLLEDSTAYIFSTLKNNMNRAVEIENELVELEKKDKDLREELKNISVDWTQYATDLTELLGTDEVKRLEEEFGLEGLKNEAADASTDESN